jgi:DMSO/TMAO reductase YedYZ molybdopterin-dependent catalytic subunit
VNGTRFRARLIRRRFRTPKTLTLEHAEETMPITRGFVGRRREHSGPLPPGQYDTGSGWPVLTAEVTPNIDPATWSLSVDGLVERPTTWSWDEIHQLQSSSYVGDIHCVTSWS